MCHIVRYDIFTTILRTQPSSHASQTCAPAPARVEPACPAARPRPHGRGLEVVCVPRQNLGAPPRVARAGRGGNGTSRAQIQHEEEEEGPSQERNGTGHLQPPFFLRSLFDFLPPPRISETVNLSAHYIATGVVINRQGQGVSW